MKIAWLSDLHLDFVKNGKLNGLLKEIRNSKSEAILISGDISTSGMLTGHLDLLAKHLELPIYFVLGNHDFYGSSIAKTSGLVIRHCAASAQLTWLSGSRPVRLTERTILLGHDSWADGRYGDYEASAVELNDYFLIDEFIDASKSERLFIMQSLAGQAVSYLKENMPNAIPKADHIIFVTHPPPFKETSRYNGKIAANVFLPHFSCRIVGDLLSAYALANPEKQFTVLCGHTHSEADIKIHRNLQVLAAQAEYEKPAIQRILEI